MKFHEKLRDVKGDMSESALATAAGLPYPSVHSYCLGRRMPTFEAVVKLARALNVSVEAFAECVGGEEPAVGDAGRTARPAGPAKRAEVPVVKPMAPKGRKLLQFELKPTAAAPTPTATPAPAAKGKGKGNKRKVKG